MEGAHRFRYRPQTESTTPKQRLGEILAIMINKESNWNKVLIEK